MEKFDIINDEYYLGLCKLDDTMKDIAKKNPHCTEFFCNLSNVFNCSKCITTLTKKKKITVDYKLKHERNLKERKNHTNKQTNKCNDCKNGFIYEFFPNNYDAFRKLDSTTDLSKIDKYKIIKNFYNDTFIYKLDEITENIKFEPTYPKPKTVVHWGQLKMFLVILFFLINKVKTTDKTVHIIYPGAAPGNTILILCQMFPNTLWYLIDPNPVHPSLYYHPMIKEVKGEYFTDETAKYYKNKFKNTKDKILLVSDIREDTNDTDVIKDQESNARWHKIINPDFSYFKFRCPYDNPKKYEYYEAKVYLQPYAPVGSTESRIIFEKDLTPKIWDIDEYQGKFNYFNRVLRPSYYNKSIIKDNEYFDHCYDCTYYSYLIRNYLDNFKDFNPFKTVDIYEIMKQITDTISKLTIDKIKIYNKMIRNNIL